MCRYISWKIKATAHGKFHGEVKPFKAGVILLTESNKFLLVKNYDGKWTFPKGGVEYREDLRNAAARELSEETGIMLPISKLRLFYKYYKHTYFICNARDINYDIEKIHNRNEITAIGWFCFDHYNEYQVAKPTLKILSLIKKEVWANEPASRCIHSLQKDTS